MQPIVVAGSANIDLTAPVPRFPRAGETLAGGDLLIGFGGKGANQAVAAARAGGAVRFLGRVGDDAYGQAYLDRLAGEKIDVSGCLRLAATPTGSALILVEQEHGENQIVICPGANGRFSPEELEPQAALIHDAALLVVQMEVPNATVRRAMALAREAGVPVLLNPSPLPADLAAVPIELADILIVNEGEAEMLAGVAPGSGAGAALAAVAQSLCARGPRQVIVTRGGKSTLYATADSATEVATFKVQPVDTVGAGDTFAGALAVALQAGRAPLEAIRWAHGAAALSTLKPGAQTAMPTGAEIEAFIARQ